MILGIEEAVGIWFMVLVVLKFFFKFGKAWPEVVKLGFVCPSEELPSFEIPFRDTTVEHVILLQVEHLTSSKS